MPTKVTYSVMAQQSNAVETPTYHQNRLYNQKSCLQQQQFPFYKTIAQQCTPYKTTNHIYTLCKTILLPYYKTLYPSTT